MSDIIPVKMRTNLERALSLHNSHNIIIVRNTLLILKMLISNTQTQKGNKNTSSFKMVKG